MQALESGEYLDKILLQSHVQGEQIDKVRKLAAEAGVPTQRVPVEKLNFLNLFNHEGCVAYKARIQYQNLQDVISQVVDAGETPLVLILDGVTDIRNIGAISRSAYAMGVHALVIPDKGVGALNEDAVLTSAGALDQIAVCRVNSLVKAVDDLHLNGIQVLATEMKAYKRIDEVDLSIPTALVMGAEEHGIHLTLQKVCDEQVQIPMSGNFESLNVSVATGIVLYEAVRQRSQK